MTQKVFPKPISSLLSEMYSPSLPLTPQAQSFPNLVKTKVFLPLSISPVSSTREPIPANSVSRSSHRANAARSKMQEFTSLTVSFPQANCLHSKHISSIPWKAAKLLLTRFPHLLQNMISRQRLQLSKTLSISAKQSLLTLFPSTDSLWILTILNSARNISRKPKSVIQLSPRSV